MSENYFESLKKYLKNCTTEAEYEIISIMDQLYSSIFILSKSGDLNEGERMLKIADKEYNSLVKSSQIEDHVNIVRLPIIAYLFFKQGNFNASKTLLEASLDASHQLEKEKDSFLLKMYQTQQYQNNARILFKKEEYNEWCFEMTRVLSQSLNYSLSLNQEETLVYVGMVDQLISEVIKFCDILKEEKYLQTVLKDLKFKHPLFRTDKFLRSIKKWCILKTKIYKFEISFSDKNKYIEEILRDDTLKIVYRKSLLKSITPYLKDEIFLNYLSIIKNKKQIC